MSREVLLEVPKDDVVDLAGVEVQELSIKRMQGALEVVELVATLTAAATPLIAAFLARPSKLPTGRRRVVIEGQRRTFENYDPEEVARILQELNGNS